jgi:hypothetical protein
VKVAQCSNLEPDAGYPAPPAELGTAAM